MRKIYLASIFFFILVPMLQGQGKMVAVTAEKEVDIQNNDVGAARILALTLAARDAVEKGFGTYVNVQELPEARKILATAAAQLKYTILEEKQRGNKYWVKIQAHVVVPDEYAKSEGEEREDMGEGMNNLVQKYPQGEINWGEGFIIAYGKGVITDTGANAEEKAARAAEVDAKGHLLEIVNDIPVDDRSRTGQDQRLSFALEGFVQGSEVVTRSRSENTVNVTVKAPIRGAKGLTMVVYGYYTPPPPPTTQPQPPKPEPPIAKPVPPKEPPAEKVEDFTGLVIDARAVPANPALFPKVQDTKQNEVYGVKQVNKEDLQKRGMASYAVVARDVRISKIFRRALVVPVSYAADPPAGAKTKRRQGYRPLVITTVEAGGPLKANIIVSEADAKKIKELGEKTNTLKEARVVVVVSSEVGGLEGSVELDPAVVAQASSLLPELLE